MFWNSPYFLCKITKVGIGKHNNHERKSHEEN